MSITQQEIEEYKRNIESVLGLDEPLPNDFYRDGKFFLDNPEHSVRLQYEDALIERAILIDFFVGQAFRDNEDIPRLGIAPGAIRGLDDVQPYLNALNQKLSSDPEFSELLSKQIGSGWYELRTGRGDPRAYSEGPRYNISAKDRFQVRRSENGGYEIAIVDYDNIEMEFMRKFSDIENREQRRAQYEALRNGQIDLSSYGYDRSRILSLHIGLAPMADLAQSASRDLHDVVKNGAAIETSIADPNQALLNGLSGSDLDIMRHKLSVHDFAVESGITPPALRNDDGSPNLTLDRSFILAEQAYISKIQSDLSAVMSIIEDRGLNGQNGLDNLIERMESSQGIWTRDTTLVGEDLNSLVNSEQRWNSLLEALPHINRPPLGGQNPVELKQYLENLSARYSQVAQIHAGPFYNSDTSPAYENNLVGLKRYLVDNQYYKGPDNSPQPFVYEPDFKGGADTVGFAYALTRKASDIENMLGQRISAFLKTNPDFLSENNIDPSDFFNDGVLSEDEVRMVEFFHRQTSNAFFNTGNATSDTLANASLPVFLDLYKEAQTAGHVAAARQTLEAEYKDDFNRKNTFEKDFPYIYYDPQAFSANLDPSSDPMTNEEIERMQIGHARGDPARRLYFALESFRVVSEEERSQLLNFLNTPARLEQLGLSEEITATSEELQRLDFPQTLAVSQLTTFLNANAANNGLGTTSLNASTVDFGATDSPAFKAIQAEALNLQRMIANFNFKAGDLGDGKREPDEKTGSLFVSFMGDRQSGEAELEILRSNLANGQLSPELLTFIQRWQATIEALPEGPIKYTDQAEAYARRRSSLRYKDTMMSEETKALYERAVVFAKLVETLPQPAFEDLMYNSASEEQRNSIDLRELIATPENRAQLLGEDYEPARATILREQLTIMNSAHQFDVRDRFFTQAYSTAIIKIQEELDLDTTGILDEQTKTAFIALQDGSRTNESLNTAQIDFIDKVLKLSDDQISTLQTWPHQEIELFARINVEYDALKSTQADVLRILFEDNKIEDLPAEVRTILASMPKIDHDGVWRFGGRSNEKRLLNAPEDLEDDQIAHIRSELQKSFSNLQNNGRPDENSTRILSLIEAMRTAPAANGKPLIADGVEIGEEGTLASLAYSLYGRGAEISDLTAETSPEFFDATHRTIVNAQNALHDNADDILAAINTGSGSPAIQQLLFEVPSIRALERFGITRERLANQSLTEEQIEVLTEITEQFIRNLPTNGTLDPNTQIAARIVKQLMEDGSQELADSENIEDIAFATGTLYNIGSSLESMTPAHQKELNTSLINAGLKNLETIIIGNRELINSTFENSEERKIPDDYTALGNYQSPDFLHTIDAATRFYQAELSENAAELARITNLPPALFVSGQTPQDAGQWSTQQTLALRAIQAHRAEIEEAGFLSTLDELIEIGNAQAGLSSRQDDLNSRIYLHNAMGYDFSIPEDFDPESSRISVTIKSTLADITEDRTAWQGVPQFHLNETTALDPTDPVFVQRFSEIISTVQNDMRTIGKTHTQNLAVPRIEADPQYSHENLVVHLLPGFLAQQLANPNLDPKLKEIYEGINASGDLAAQNESLQRALVAAPNNPALKMISQAFSKDINALQAHLDLGLMNSDQQYHVAAMIQLDDIANVGLDRSGVLGNNTLINLDAYFYYMSLPGQDPAMAKRAQDFKALLESYATAPENSPTLKKIDVALLEKSSDAPGVEMPPASPYTEEQLKEMEQLKLATTVLDRAADSFGFEFDPESIEDPRQINGLHSAQFIAGYESQMDKLLTDGAIQDMIWGVVGPEGGNRIGGDSEMYRFRRENNDELFEYHLQADGSLTEYRVIFNQDHPPPHGILDDRDREGNLLNLDEAHPDRTVRDMNEISVALLNKIIETQAAKLNIDTGDKPTTTNDILERRLELADNIKGLLGAMAQTGEDPEKILTDLRAKSYDNQALAQRLQVERGQTGSVENLNRMIVQLHMLDDLANLSAARDLAAYVSEGVLPDGSRLNNGTPNLEKPWEVDWNQKTYRLDNGELNWSVLNEFRVHKAEVYQRFHDGQEIQVSENFSNNKYAMDVIEKFEFGDSLNAVEFATLTRELMIKEAADMKGITDYDSPEAKQAFLDAFREGHFHLHDMDLILQSFDADQAALQYAIEHHMDGAPVPMDMDNPIMVESATKRFRWDAFNDAFGQEETLRLSDGSVLHIKNATITQDEAASLIMRMPHYREKLGITSDERDGTLSYDDMVKTYGDDFVRIAADAIERTNVDEFYRIISHGHPEADFKGIMERRFQNRYQTRLRDAYIEPKLEAPAPKVSSDADLTAADAKQEQRSDPAAVDAGTGAEETHEEGGTDVIVPGAAAEEEKPASKNACDLQENCEDIVAPPPAHVIDGATPAAIQLTPTGPR